jgi:hypothetical protein
MRRLLGLSGVVCLLTVLTIGCDEPIALWLGTVRVAVATTGVDLDSEGYRIVLDEQPSQAVAANGSVTLNRVLTGSHTIGLYDIATNCRAVGDSSRSVNVTFGDTAVVEYVVTCAALVGSLQVNVSTIGLDIDSDGYSVLLDGSLISPIGTNAQLRDSTVRAGDHTIQLAGIADNCSVTTTNPMPITIRFNATAAVSFSVTCVSTHGTYRVTTTTNGDDPDPDGYVICIDPINNGAFCNSGAAPIAPAGTVDLTISAGSHTLLLELLAANCRVVGDNPRALNIAAGDTINLTFSIACVPRPRLRVITTTTGPLNLGSYWICIDQYGSCSPPVVIGLNDTVTTAIDTGLAKVSLGYVPNNCTVAGEYPRVVTATGSDTTEVAFAINCVPSGLSPSPARLPPSSVRWRRSEYQDEQWRLLRPGTGRRGRAPRAPRRSPPGYRPPFPPELKITWLGSAPSD